MDEADAEEGILITPGDDSWREMHSSAEGNEGKLTVRNCLQLPVILCWIDPQGELANPAVIESNDCLAVCTYASHCFVCFHALDPVPGCVADVPDDCFVFYYRLCQGSREHAITINRGRSNQHLRGSFYRDRPAAVISVVITRPPAQAPWDTITINGFTLRTEPGLFDDHPMLGSALLVDLSAVCALIPIAHLQRIASSTATFINSAGNCEDMAYHPQHAEAEAEKQGCIEVYSAECYLDSRQHWGPGGMLLHELCHAFHDKCVPDGYQNNDILHAYYRAMQSERYENVPAHGRSNGRHYACTNAQEFFAELSVAYLWQKDEETEFNRWFPFNRKQLLAHDSDTCELLDRLWSVG